MSTASSHTSSSPDPCQRRGRPGARSSNGRSGWSTSAPPRRPISFWPTPITRSNRSTGPMAETLFSAHSVPTVICFAFRQAAAGRIASCRSGPSSPTRAMTSSSGAPQRFPDPVARASPSCSTGASRSAELASSVLLRSVKCNSSYTTLCLTKG